MSADVPRFEQIAGALAANGWSPLPLHYGRKNPIPEGWQHFKFKAADAHKKRFATAGVGILCGEVVGIDIDCRDAPLAAELEALAGRLLGAAPRRIGLAPKVLLPYRAAAPFRKIQTRGYRLPGDAPEEKAHRVEALAEGEQFVAYNLHPDTGTPYTWNGVGDPLTVPVSTLAAVTEAQVQEFIRQCEALLGRHGEAVGRLRMQDSSRDAKPNEELRARDTALLREALGAIPNEDLEYDDWVYLGLALKGALGAEGREDFFAWSAQSAKHEARETERAWESFAPRTIGAGTIFHLAAARGWRRAAAVTTDDFFAYMPGGNFIFVPTRELWPAASVNERCGDSHASARVAAERPIDQMTWAPGEPTLIGGRLIAEGGWIERPGCNTFNLYRPPIVSGGDAQRADPWLDHLRKVFPESWEHILHFLAHRVQRPGEKINHALVLGGAQGIGKDTMLEPVKRAVGPWNFVEVSPTNLTGRFNGFVKAVVLRISEARDLGEVDRYAFYEHLKVYTAAPPDVLRCDEKNIREHAVMNVCGVIITTNQKAGGFYLPADDRRHYVAWSELTKEQFPADYWRELWGWFAQGGAAHVAAMLATVDLSGFDPKAPPPKTAAFWDIVDCNRAPEDAELADLLDDLGNPAAVTKEQLLEKAEGQWAEIGTWMRDRRNAKAFSHRMESAGYVSVRNEANARDGLWVIGRSRAMVYARKDLAVRERYAAAAELAAAVRR